jgi:hypothetical protein
LKTLISLLQVYMYVLVRKIKKRYQLPFHERAMYEDH